ncbi:65-kDa microtubule-associated protein 3-like isoform X2 [Gossypium australe]|uniref:65-kDa microtubule-associated protein 3-like isoform X2 n=1 Tax=Gossypium australe TaxID=47621 RepID=A0A5B6UJC9_9ROSI|nr:65-kDa microtubule-associated protein 3-like isoform X2 [Gossypium australe]
MSTQRIDPLVQVETTCRALLNELQIIWEEVGETYADRDEMLLELERECVEVYRRKVDQANHSKAHIRQTIADSEAELAAICSAMGERPVHIRQSDQNIGSLKEELRKILSQVEEMKKRKEERRNHFIDVLDQIEMIRNEINGSTESVSSETVVDETETDLSLMRLEELHRQLHELLKEKSNRLKQVQDHLNTLNSLCSVMGMDFKLTATEVHPSLGDSEGSRSISNNTLEQLGTEINKLREVKIQRMERLQDLATTMLELWNLMDTPIEEQQKFQNVTCNVAASEHEITEPNTLSDDFINYVEEEVSRLEDLKSSKMKEIILKKRAELKEISTKTHLIPDTQLEDAIEAIDSGVVDAATILEQIELQIAKVKEEAFSRKEILEKVEKWLAACEEESWLEEYNRDENRYNAGRGTHLTLKRAEKARSLVNKLPGRVEALTSKIMAWEEERGSEFLYDGTPVLSMLEDYANLREEKEQERRRLRDQKRLQGQLIAEQEVLYGAKQSPPKPQSAKKGSKQCTGVPSTKKVALGGPMLQAHKLDSVNSLRISQTRSNKKTEFMLQNDAIPASPAFNRGQDIADAPFRKHPSNGVNTNEIESQLKTIPTNDPSNNTMTPLKTISSVDEENRKPKAMHSTASVQMQTDITPPPTLQTSLVEETHEEMEQSFEEKRLALMHSDKQIPSMIQV